MTVSRGRKVGSGVSEALFHWAHRFRFTVVDLGLRASKRAIAVACYGSAVIGSILGALIIISLSVHLWHLHVDQC